MDFLVRFCQLHEAFRLAEIQALAVVEDIDLKILDYSDDSPYCLINVPSAEAAKALVRRSILVQTVYELWGTGETYPALHDDVRKRTSHLWDLYRTCSFRFNLDNYRYSHTRAHRLELINTFSYLPFKGKIMLENASSEFTIFEEWPYGSMQQTDPTPTRLHLGRLIGSGSRELCLKYDLKKREYISTTSMDSELALVTANLTLADKGKLFYDPFVGTGSFPIACAQFGALGFGSDIDGRSMRGDGGKKSLNGNFEQYGLQGLIGDFFAADITNTPLRVTRWLDGIVCDPPYGVREGLRVLGCRDPEKSPWVIENAMKNWKEPYYVPPRKPYSFLAMLDDILAFASASLVDDGRISFWMPTANDEDQEIAVPAHPCLIVVSVCSQVFNKWSRRLITYRRVPDNQVNKEELESHLRTQHVGKTADELNPFRRGYFQKFEKVEEA